MKVGLLYGILQGNLIKIVIGFFISEVVVQVVLFGIQELGYKDVFVKNVFSGYLFFFIEFEIGIKKLFIFLLMNENFGFVVLLQSYD